ncbi:acyltransferase family protein [Pseudobutyrivibrio ruminis]|uniref:acyltransferase family protein n=1 Tax=Pseudobutyrivibrio ruminis TaxID=46206 RepID=UPI00041EFD91|nr:acyltransferase [Pseudobutyrivibrio ruminis]
MEKRNSSIELLRIVMMFLIIAHHYCYHGVEACFSEKQQMLAVDMWINVYLIQILHFVGIIGNGTFAVISGYFLINKTASNVKKIKRILIEYIGYILVFIILALLFMARNGWDIEIGKRITDIWTSGNWFITCYIILLLIIPNVNKGISIISEKEYRNLLIILSTFGFILPGFRFYTGMNIQCSVEGLFIMYLWGGYLKKYGTNNWWSKKNIFTIVVILSILVMGFLVLGNQISMIHSSDTNSTIMNFLFPLVGFFYPLLIFLYANKFEFYSRTVNKISQSVLAIYIIHDNPIVREIIWKRFSPNINYYSKTMFTVHLLCKVILVFCGALLIDQSRLYICSKIRCLDAQKSE